MGGPYLHGRKDMRRRSSHFVVTTHSRHSSFPSFDFTNLSLGLRLHDDIMDVELHDWEVVDDWSSGQNTSYLEGIEGDSEGIVRSDYFSLDSDNKYFAAATHVETDQTSVESDNPSWMDPVCCYPKTDKPIGELWSTDGSESEGSNKELARQVESLAEIEPICEKTDADFVSEARKHEEINRRVGFWWWKDLLKYCLLKASSPVFVAAAVVGAVILGRRLYNKMKQKARILQLKVAIDDKKISQVMSRAARLNEAFSVVKRGPMIRPSLPAANRIAPWPVMAALR